MVQLTNLMELEAAAEKEFEEKADIWVRVLADREGVENYELRPYVVSLGYEPDQALRITFVLPGHVPIQVWAEYYAFRNWSKDMPRIEDGKLVGDYCWMARRSPTGSFTGAKSLGHALLIARWAYEQDERVNWV